MQPTVDFEVVSLIHSFFRAGRRHGTLDKTFHWWQLSLKQSSSAPRDGRRKSNGRRRAEEEAEGEAAQKLSRHDVYPMRGILLASCLHASLFK